MNLGADVLQLPEGLVLTIDTPPDSNAASIEVARSFARIDTSLDDNLIQPLMTSAIDKVEAFINRKLITQTIIAHWEIGAPRMVLPFGKVQSVSLVEIGQTDGTFVEDTDFVLKANTVYLSSTEEGTSNDVRITYVTGYGDSESDVPGVIKEAIYKMIVTSYDNREDLIIGESVMILPNSSKRELKQFINYESF